jgi:hypothetical protein
VNVDQQRQLNDGLFHQSHGSFDLVLAPVMLSLLGLGLDKATGLLPFFTVTFAILGAIGAAAKLYYGYRAATATATAPAGRAEVGGR